MATKNISKHSLRNKSNSNPEAQVKVKLEPWNQLLHSNPPGLGAGFQPAASRTNFSFIVSKRGLLMCVLCEFVSNFCVQVSKNTEFPGAVIKEVFELPDMGAGS